MIGLRKIKMFINKGRVMVLALVPALIFGQELEFDFDIRPGTLIRETLTFPTIRSSSSSDIGDTLFYTTAWNAQFIMSPGDAMMTVFQMPADGYLKGVNIPVYEWGTGNQELTVSLHKLSYPYRADSTLYSPAIVDIDGWIGGYDMNDSGWVAIMGNEYTPGGTTGICNPGASVADYATDPFADTEGDSLMIRGWIWPNSVPVILTPATHPAYVNGGGDNWFAMSDYGNEPFLAAGAWVGILVRFTGTGGGDDDAVGLFYTDGYGMVDPWTSLKFYHGCTGTSGNGGWHIRHWVFDFELAILLTGDRAPQILDWTPLTTTLSTADREITATIIDDNPSGGNAGVDSVLLYYSIDNQTTWSEISMADNGDSTFTGFIPGQPPATTIVWYIRAVDVNGNETRTLNQHYFIFAPLHDFLVLVNYNSSGLGIFQPPGWPLIPNAPVDYDVWYCLENGPATMELLNHYDAVIELTGDGPVYEHDQALNDFIGAGGHYLIAGDNWFRTEWESCLFENYMLLEDCYTDISYLEPGDGTRASRLLPVNNDPISGGLASFLGDSLNLNYDPYYEFGHYNGLDAMAPSSGDSVAFYGVSGVLDSTGTPTGNDTLPVGVYYELDTGSRIVLFSFDPMAINTTPSYHWISIVPYGPLQSAMAWMAEALSTRPDDSSLLPTQFILHQNYPNPFNPITAIRFELPEQAPVNLTIYDLQGRKIDVLVDEVLAPGNHEMVFEVGNLSSGVYFYRISTPTFTQTRKLVVLK